MPLGTKAGQLPPSAGFEDERLNLQRVGLIFFFFWGFFHVGIARLEWQGHKGSLSPSHPVVAASPGDAGGPGKSPPNSPGRDFMAAPGGEFCKMKAGMDPAGFSLPLQPLLEGRKMSSKFWGSNSCESSSSRSQGNGSGSHRNSPLPSRFSLGTAGDKFRAFLSCCLLCVCEKDPLVTACFCTTSQCHEDTFG